MCEQLTDELIWNGDSVAICPLPVVAGPQISYDPASAMPVSTAHIRGYVAHWELVDQQLYLNEVEGCYRLKSQGPVFAGWVDAVITPPSGVYGQFFEMTVKQGVVIEAKP